MMPSRPASRTKPKASPRAAIEANNVKLIKQLSDANIRELKARYAEIYRRSPPNAFGPDLLRHSIAYRLQCQSHGGLKAATLKKLRAIAKRLESKTDAAIELNRKIKLGSELIRTWKEKSYRVAVVQGGYRYDGEVYASLSEIASQITGTNWNGPRFFGLRAKTVRTHVDDK